MSQGSKTFLRNHAEGIASIDMFVVPTISFRSPYGFLVLPHSRPDHLWLGVTAHPSAEWIARQLTEACGWREPPRYIVIAMAPMARLSFGASQRWGYGIARFRLALRQNGHAERLRIDSAGLPRPRRDVCRAASPSLVQLLPRILQRESCRTSRWRKRADSAQRPEDRTRARVANLGRASASVRSSVNI